MREKIKFWREKFTRENLTLPTIHLVPAEGQPGPSDDNDGGGGDADKDDDDSDGGGDGDDDDATVGLS